jgi:hypothetical protein
MLVSHSIRSAIHTILAWFIDGGKWTDVCESDTEPRTLHNKQLSNGSVKAAKQCYQSRTQNVKGHVALANSLLSHSEQPLQRCCIESWGPPLA